MLRNNLTPLERLDIIVGDGPAPSWFKNEAVGSKDIDAFEQNHSIRLSDSYKAFLEFFNGGMLLSDSLNNILKSDNDLETVKWNANYLFSLAEMESKYEELSSWDYGLQGFGISPYPFIPFCQTSTGELLVFITLQDKDSESPVFDAYHEDFPSTWGVVAKDFDSFLEKYVIALGFPDMLGELADGNAMDHLENLVEKMRPGSPPSKDGMNGQGQADL